MNDSWPVGRPVEGRRHLSLCKGHGEVRKKSHSVDAEVWRQTLGMDDGARTDIDECAAREVAVLQVEVNHSVAAHDDAQTVIIDGERWLLTHQQTEHRAVAANHCQFTIHEYMFADLREVWCENVAHSCGIHQLRLSVHNTSFLLAKIIILCETMLCFLYKSNKKNIFPFLQITPQRKKHRTFAPGIQ